MTIQPISTASLALYLTPADLQERGLCADELTADHTLELTREAFRQAGLPLDKPLEIESYPDKCGLLVFVHICSPQQTIWSFEDFEALLAAVSFLHTKEADVSLYWYNDLFWLVLSGSYDFLSEFGRQETEDSYIQARLREYGTPLLSGQVLSTLHRHF